MYEYYDPVYTLPESGKQYWRDQLQKTPNGIAV
jgi:hypothetical protein